MSIFTWFEGLKSGRTRAMSRYKRGMARAKEHDHEGAIADYTSVIAMSNAPNDVLAMALYNRALVYAAAGDGAAGTDDLDVVLSMDDVPSNVKTMAKQKLARIETRKLKETNTPSDEAELTADGHESARADSASDKHP